MGEASITWRDGDGKERSRPAPDVNSIINYPESYPEARQRGAQIVSGDTVSWYDSNGQFHTTRRSIHY